MTTELTVEHIECPSPEYLAGFFDGEGCVHYEKSRARSDKYGGMTRQRITVSICNTYLPIIVAIQREYGGSICDGGIRARRLQPFWQLHLKGPAAGRFLTAILPFLTQKRDRANAALFVLDTHSWTRTGSRLSKETEHVRELVRSYMLQHPNGKAGKGGGAKRGQGRPLAANGPAYIFNSAASAILA